MEKRIFLRAFEYEDLEVINEIRNDDENFELTGGNKYFISSEYDKKWIEDKIFNNQKQIYLAICLNNQKIIGYLCITNIDFRNNIAKFGGINIHKEHSGNGFGTEATKLLLKYVFEELGINRFYGFWLEANLASIRMAEKAGFIKEGLVRDFVFKRNKYHNAFLMSVLRKDYCQSLANERE